MQLNESNECLIFGVQQPTKRGATEKPYE